ncbi:hypothetical protein ACOQFO_04100 [Ureibacillus sp. MALMAid1270]|uniref:hypothetical protein n=1 Tax=Ureibacillus sp. MALMAid1270 TaxID=3411629 RepID=UPI003BA69CC1
MVYYARNQRDALGFLLGILVAKSVAVYFIGAFQFGALFFVEICLMIYILLLFFMKFTIKIDNELLTYQVFLFSWRVYIKVLTPDQISYIQFRRVGWASKGAVVHVKKGLNVRVYNFKAENILKDLIHFANEHQISFSKSKDYLILEK